LVGFVTSCAALLCSQPCSTPTLRWAQPTWLNCQLLLCRCFLYDICRARSVGSLGLRAPLGCLFGEHAVQARLEAGYGAVPPSFPAHRLDRIGRIAVEYHRALEVRLRAVMAGHGSEASCDFCASSCRVAGSRVVRRQFTIALQPRSAPCEVSNCSSFFCPDDATCLQLPRAQSARTRNAAVASNARHA
jgi:hypothetical protein